MITRLSQHLAELPGLAARTARTGTSDHDPAPGGAPARFVRPLPGSRVPPGVDLGAVDASPNRQQSRDQLARLGQCVRVVCEEGGDLRWTWPELTSEDRVTWASETGWLLATMGWWSTDQWCAEWIAGEVAAIRGVLIERADRELGRCCLCDGPIQARETETLAIAECARCERVISMREREALTTAEAARRLGISEAAVRKRIERGDLRKVGRRGRTSLVAPADGLDWARRKLGLIDDLSASRERT